MQKKKGISLIVLVITIIIMIILAAVVIVALNNSGIISKANEAVAKHDLKQVQTLVSTLWAEAYLDPSITEDEQYRQYIERELTKSGITLDKYIFNITAQGATVEGPDLEKPTITLTADKQGVVAGESMTYTVVFSDNKEVASVDFDTNDVTLTGFTAQIEITGEGNERTITLSNIQGELGEKVVTISTGAAKDVAGNLSNETTVRFNIVATLASLITSAADYGKTINYISDNGITEWKVFYHTEDYVYIIASESLALDKLPVELKDVHGAKVNAAEIAISETYTKEVAHVWWNPMPKGADVAEGARDKWMAYWLDFNLSNYHTKGTTIFIYEEIWKAFRNSEKYKDNNGNSYVKGAIGSPTAEMFVASWNAKREVAVAGGDKTTYNKKLSLRKISTGYFVDDITNNPDAYSNTTGQDISAGDLLYIWNLNEKASYWLASPSGNSPSNIMSIYSGYTGAALGNTRYFFSNEWI